MSGSVSKLLRKFAEKYKFDYKDLKRFYKGLNEEERRITQQTFKRHLV